MHLVMQHSLTVRIMYLRLSCELACIRDEGIRHACDSRLEELRNKIN